jgi:hypothetical protein
MLDVGAAHPAGRPGQVLNSRGIGNMRKPSLGGGNQ